MIPIIRHSLLQTVNVMSRHCTRAVQNKVRVFQPPLVSRSIPYSTEVNEFEGASNAKQQRIPQDTGLKKYFKTKPQIQEEKLNILEASSPEAETPEDPVQEITDSGSWSNISSMKYEQFDQSNPRIIYDISEEQLGLIEPEEQQPTEMDESTDTLTKVSLERGKDGVYDVPELVEVLRLEKAKNLVVMEIPARISYVDHMFIVSANSQRHLNSIAMTVRKVYNKKKFRKDPGLILEGRDTDWVAIDMGNIAIHIMSPQQRTRVNLESLWLCGPELDSQLHDDAVEKEESELFTLSETVEDDTLEKPYDITKEYDHPFHIVKEDEMLPDIVDINDSNRLQYNATSLVEMTLRKHNKELSKKFRGRFRK